MHNMYLKLMRRSCLIIYDTNLKLSNIRRECLNSSANRLNANKLGSNMYMQ